MKGGPVRATKAGSDLYPLAEPEKCREEAPADAGALVFGRLASFALYRQDETVALSGLTPISVVHICSDDDPEEPRPAKPPKPQRGYTTTPGLMSHMLRYAHAFKQEHGRLPTEDERAAERERFRKDAGLHSPAYDMERHKRMRRESYLRRKARATK